jgi:prophage regulatory protein
MSAVLKNTERLLTIHQVIRRVGLSRNTIYSLIRKGEFPKQVKIGYSSRWLESEIDTWMDFHAKARGGHNVQ